MDRNEFYNELNNLELEGNLSITDTEVTGAIEINDVNFRGQEITFTRCTFKRLLFNHLTKAKSIFLIDCVFDSITFEQVIVKLGNGTLIGEGNIEIIKSVINQRLFINQCKLEGILNFDGESKINRLEITGLFSTQGF